MPSSSLAPHRVRLVLLVLTYLTALSLGASALPSSSHDFDYAAASSASSLLLNQPSSGDSLRLTQPSADWASATSSDARRREKAARLARSWGVSMSEGAPRDEARAGGGGGGVSARGGSVGTRRSRSTSRSTAGRNSTGRRGADGAEEAVDQARSRDATDASGSDDAQNVDEEHNLDVGLSESRVVTQEQQHRHIQDRRDAQLHLDAKHGSQANVNEPRS